MNHLPSMDDPGKEARIRQLEQQLSALTTTHQELLEDHRAHKETEAALQRSEARLRAIFDTEPECVKLLAADGSLIEMNPAGLRMLEADSFQQLENHCVYLLVVAEHRTAFRELTERVFLGESGSLEFQIIGLRGGRRWLETHATPLRDASGAITAMLGITRDITQRKQAEAITASQTQVLELIAKDVPLAETLAAMLEHIEAMVPTMLCSVLLLDGDGQHLRHGAAPSLPDAYNRAIDGLRIGPCVGSCGTAAFRREQVTVEDIATDPLWADYRELALAHGLRACWSTPIFDAQQCVLGTFAIYYRQPGRPTVLDLRCVDLATGLAAVAISRKRAEAALQMMRFSVDHAGDAVFWVSPEGRILYANDSACAGRGYSREELLGMTIFDLDPDYQPGIWPAHWAELKRCGTLTFETRHRSKDGRVFPIEVNANYVQASGQEFNFAFVRDITERKQAEDALREIAQLFRLFVEHSPAAIAMLDCDMRYLVASHRWLTDFRLCEQDVIGRSHYDLFPDIPERWKVIHRRCLGGAVEKSAADEFPHADGSTDWLRWEMRPWHTSHGAIGGVIIFSERITERKRAEEALRESEAKFSKVFRNSPDAVLLTTLDGHILDANAGFTRLTGFEIDEVRSRTTLGLGFWADLADRQRFLAGLCDHGRMNEMEATFCTRAGALRTCLISGELMDLGGQPAIIGVVRDITERKQAEHRLAESGAQLRALLARLQRAREEERIRVSREIHDELGQLLTGLKMDVRWIERKLSDPGLPPALNPLLDRAVAASELADATIATVQKIAAELRPGTLDHLGLEAALNQEARRFRERSGVRCVVVIAESLPALPPETAGELYYICQEALTNVARHAQATSVVIGLKTDGGDMLLELRDDGVGMAGAELNAPHSLGLLGMRERAAQCGGTITFTRNVPQGTRVAVRVPLANDERPMTRQIL
ncbi:MAG: PAS domain S-box protein [Prosthecobacter sp.]|uniref:PAS domain S-box protein n=1 Tax=Prosthecobacter sp. TaxID=1965333 RepID=UPI0038FE8F5A